jgi:hypothetical protein
MLKLKSVGETAITPFPHWPPVHKFDWKSEERLKRHFSRSSGDLKTFLVSLRGDEEKHACEVIYPLGSLYAHYFGYPDAPDLSDIAEGESEVVRVKRILEDEMINVILGLQRPDVPSIELGQEATADYLKALSLDNPGVNHPFFDFIADNIMSEGMREFLWLEVIRNEVVDDEVAKLVPGLQHAMKQVIASNLWDECGNGKIDGFHTSWLVRLLSYGNQWPEFMAYRERRPWFSMLTSHSFNSLLTSPGRVCAAYGTFLINESWVAPHFEKILKAMDRLGIVDEDRRIYFDAHYTIDKLHRAEMVEGLRQQNPPLSRTQLYDVVIGAHQAIAAGKVMYDHLLGHFLAKVPANAKSEERC